MARVLIVDDEPSVRESLVRIAEAEGLGTIEAEDGAADRAVERKLHRTIHQVSEQIPALQFNAAIAAMMEYLNVVRAGGRTPKSAEVEPLVLLVAPFAPHIAEELYARLGHTQGLFDTAHWPAFDPDKIVADSVEIVVQVNGKMRGRVEVPNDADEDTVVAAAKKTGNVTRHLENKRFARSFMSQEGCSTSLSGDENRDSHRIFST